VKKFYSVIYILLLSFTCSYGQQVSDSSKVLTDRYNNIFAGLQLDTLPGNIKVLYTKHYEVRAKAVQTLVINCCEYYHKMFPQIIFNLQVLILDSAGWNMVAREIPNSLSVYGLPDAEWRVNRIFIAADKKAVAQLFGLTDNLPDSILSEFDNISLHELGHIFLFRYNKTRTGKKWADEFLASYFALCYLKHRNDTLRLPQIDLTSYQPKYKTLDNFELLYEDVGPPNYAWYQGKFQKLATLLYPKFKVELLKEFIKNYSANGKKPDPLDLLKRLAPQITNQWLEEMVGNSL
jgi:hypothetical protein